MIEEEKHRKTYEENYALFNSVNIPQGLVPMCYPADFFDGNYIPKERAREVEKISIKRFFQNSNLWEEAA